MKRMGKRILAVLMLAVMVVNGGYVTTTVKAAESPQKEIVIFHTNDMHGHMDEGIGIARVAAMKKATPNSLLFDGGDAIQGAPMATLSSGEDVVKLMNLAGYDAMCTGNHEYDYGQEQLLKIRELAEYPMLAANVKKDGEALLKGIYGAERTEGNGQYTLIEKNGVNVGVFGLTTQETKTSSNPAGLIGIDFEDEVETAKSMIDTLEAQGADIIICLAHLGDTKTVPHTAEQLAESLTDTYEGKLDAIIDAHSHAVENKVVNGVQISQTGTALANLGKMSITYNEETDDVDIQAELIPESEFTQEGTYSEITPDAEIEAALANITEKNQELMKERIADTETTLWGGTINNVAEGRVTETNLGNLVADSMLDAGEEIIRNGNVADEYKNLPIVTMQNGGGIRATIQKGTITKGDIINVLPFGNTISFKAVTPKLLYEILEQGVSANSGLTKDGLMAGTQASGGFPQIGGMRFTYDPNKENGSKVKAVYLTGETEPLQRDDENRQIIIGSNDFLISGGNGYTMLDGLPQVAEGGALDIMLENTILKRTENGTKPLKVPVKDDRIVVESDDYTPKNYTAYVEVHDMNGALETEKEITYYVDESSNTFKGMTDKDGLLKIDNLSDGAHTIGAVYGNREAYVCSYTGTGIILTFTKTYPQINVDLKKQQEEEQKTGNDKPDEKPLSYTVTFVNGKTVKKTTVQQGKKADALKVSKRRYIFRGWYLGNEKYNFDKVVTKDITLTAKWKKVKVPKTLVSKIKIKKKKVIITVKKKSGIVGYQIKIGSNRKLTKNKKLMQNKKNQFTVKKWKKKILYVKVRAYKIDSLGKRVYGKWSKIKRRKISR